MVWKGRAVKPGVSLSMMKQLMPLRPLSGSVRTNTTPQSASWAWEMKIFAPLMTQASPSRTARVRIAPAGSEPPLGSVIAKKVYRPCSSVGTAYFRICSGVPA